MSIIQRQLYLSALVAIGIAFMSVSSVGWRPVSVLVQGPKMVPPPPVYRWQANGSNDWQVASNWSPARITPANDDILVFSTGETTIVANIPTQVIGQLVISGNTTVDLRSPGTAILSIGGGTGTDLTVEAYSVVELNGENAIVINLASGTTGDVSGAMTFSSTSTAAHRLTAVDAGSVVFKSGSTFTAGPGFAGNPFGATNLNSVIFAENSKYVAVAGGDPFGAGEPDSVVSFEPGSWFSLQGNAMVSFSGRRYANFEVNFPPGIFIATGSSAMVIDELVLNAGKLELNLSGNPGHSIRGDITLASGTRLGFGSGVIFLNGPGVQTIAGTGSLSSGGASIIAIDNPNGVVLNRPFPTWNLDLISGVLTAPFSVLVAGTLTRTDGYVNGQLFRYLPAGGLVRFDVGTENGYTPVTAEVTDGTFPAVLSVKAIQSANPNIFDSSRALSRYWEISKQGSVRATLTFQYRDPEDIPSTANEAEFLIYRYNDGFIEVPGIIDGVANTFTVSDISDVAADWTLAEPGAVNGPTPTPTLTPTPTPTPSPSPSAADALFDYDGDGKTDFSVFRPSSGAWYLQRSTAGFQGLQFGASGDKLTPADYDGDGKTDIAIYRPSTGIWYILNSSNGTVSYPVFGVAEDLPAPGDYDGDGKADWTVFRPSQGTWYRTNSSNGTTFGMQFGATGDVPTVGDFDGDGKNDLGIFRPSVGDWYNIRSSNGSVFGERFGQTGDRIAPADYDGDGKTDIAIYRPSTGLWVVRNSATATYSYEVFGLPADVPISGDYDGDGKADIGVWRPSDGTWYIKRSDNSQFIVFPWGQTGDKPTPSAYGN